MLDKKSDLGYSIQGMKKLVIREQDTIRKKVYRHLREQILRGEIGPNDRLIEVKIAGADRNVPHAGPGGPA